MPILLTADICVAPHSYLDKQGKAQSMEKLDQATSELLQHEIDHMNGILAVYDDLPIDTTAHAPTPPHLSLPPQ